MSKHAYDFFVCACVMLAKKQQLMCSKLQRLRYQTYQVPLEVQMQNRNENRTSSNSIGSERKPF